MLPILVYETPAPPAPLGSKISVYVTDAPLPMFVLLSTRAPPGMRATYQFVTVPASAPVTSYIVVLMTYPHFLSVMPVPANADLVAPG